MSSAVRESLPGRLVARPAFWAIALALLAGGPLLSGLLRRPPPALPVLDQVPATGRGRLVTYADPGCPDCMAVSAASLRTLARHLRSVRPGFDLEWVLLGNTPDLQSGPATVIADPERAGPLLSFLRRRPEQTELRRGERAVLIDAWGRIRALPALAVEPSAELLPAITQVVNGR